MGNEREIVGRIHESHFSRRLHILKGFKEVIGTAPVHLSELRKAIGEDEPIYTLDNLRKYTSEVLQKGNEDEISKAKEVLDSLQAKEVIDLNGNIGTVYFYVEKGLPGKNNLVEKKITDKTGKPTTKWVNPNKEEGDEEDQADNSEEETDDDGTDNAAPGGGKSVADHAKETPSEHLKKYLQENPDGEHAEHAKSELQARGESDEEGDENQEIDYSNPEAVKAALQDPATQEAVMALMVDDPTLTAAQALKLNSKTSTNHADTHAKIDAAQAALDDLKTHTGHPGAGNSEDGEGESGNIKTDALIDTLADKAFNSQGNLDIEAIKDTYQQLTESGMSREDIEAELAPMTWDNPDISDEERQGFSDQWASIVAQLDSDEEMDEDDSDNDEDEEEDGDQNSFDTNNNSGDGGDEDEEEESDDDSDSFGSDNEEEDEDDESGNNEPGGGADGNDPNDDQDGFKFDGSDNTDDVLNAFKDGKVSNNDVANHFEKKQIK